MPCANSDRVGLGFVFRNPTVAMMKPDMQNAHWKPCSSMTPCCTACSVPSALASPSTVTIFCPRTECVSTDARMDTVFHTAVLPKIEDAINHAPEFTELRRVRVAANDLRPASASELERRHTAITACSGEVEQALAMRRPIAVSPIVVKAINMPRT